MPTSEPDPATQRQPSATYYAAVPLLQNATQYLSLAVELMAMTQVLAHSPRSLLRLMAGHGSAPVATENLPLSATRLRSYSGMDF